MFPTLVGEVVRDQQQTLRDRAAAERRARQLTRGAAGPRSRSHRPHLSLALRSWLAAGQL